LKVVDHKLGNEILGAALLSIDELLISPDFQVSSLSKSPGVPDLSWYNMTKCEKCT
jgi:hypothetical protein